MSIYESLNTEMLNLLKNKLSTSFDLLLINIWFCTNGVHASFFVDAREKFLKFLSSADKVFTSTCDFFKVCQFLKSRLVHCTFSVLKNQYIYIFNLNQIKVLLDNLIITRNKLNT